MDTLTRDQLEILCKPRAGLCVSIFLPTHHADLRQNPVRLKNLLREAETRMVSESVQEATARQILAPARQLTQGNGFWREPGDGVAIYLAEDFFQCFRLPLALPERLVVSHHFEVKLLLPLFSAGGSFYVLCISRNRVRLFEGTHFGIREFNLENVPQGVREALKYEVHEPQRQVHSGTGSPHVRKKAAGVFHGQGVGVDDAKDKTLEYFRQVNRGLKELLKDPSAPLVLAGVEDLFPIYRQANTYPRLLEPGITGNPDEMTASELEKRAAEVLRPYFEGARHQAIARYQSLAGTAETSNQLPDVVRAAHEGRLEFAFIPTNVERWGRFNPNEGTVEVHENPQPGDEDLVNDVAIQTILTRGAIYTITPQDLPDASPLAAVFRY